MAESDLRFAVDAEKLGKLKLNFLNSKEGMDACSSGQLKGEERLFISLMETHLLNTSMYFPNKKIIQAGDKFEEAYFLVNGEVLIKQNDKSHRLGAGAVLGLSEGMVSLPSKYTAIAMTTLRVKIIPFHKVHSIIKFLPAELKAIMVTIIKRNLAP